MPDVQSLLNQRGKKDLHCRLSTGQILQRIELILYPIRGVGGVPECTSIEWNPCDLGENLLEQTVWISVHWFHKKIRHTRVFQPELFRLLPKNAGESGIFRSINARRRALNSSDSKYAPISLFVSFHLHITTKGANTTNNSTEYTQDAIKQGVCLLEVYLKNRYWNLVVNIRESNVPMTRLVQSLDQNM